MDKISKVIKNTSMLYIVSIAKLVLPLVTLPYLTRVLSENSYGFVAYVKSIMTYMQLIIDFGFILSSVKDIVNAGGDKEKIGIITGNTFASKVLLIVVSFAVLVIMACNIKLLQLDIGFVFFSFLATASTAFFGDFFFRGVEKMQFVSISYIASKGVSTILTFVFVKNDSSLLWIPIFDIISNVIAISISFILIAKMGVKIRISNLFDCIKMIKDSFIYFMSSVATTAFSALNTVIIGIFIIDLKQVAYWSICLNIVSAIQGLYAPICNGIYPHMIKEKDLSFIHKTLCIFMPIVLAGCVFSYFIADFALNIIGGEKYIQAATLFRFMIPILFFSFPAQIYGWPTLGSIGKQKATTLSTVVAAVFQISGLILLGAISRFTLINIAVLRGLTEFVLLFIRAYITYKNKTLFAKNRWR